MEHWSPPDSFTAEDPGAPQDAWARWLLRAPSHEIEPDHRRANDWAGGAMMLGVVLFWVATALLLWRAFG